VTTRIVAVALTCMAMTACVPETPLPTATATLHFAQVDLPRGSYCWNSGTHGECADSAGPDQLLARGYLKPYRTAGGFDATITFHGPSDPKTFDVQLLETPAGVGARSISASGDRTFHVDQVTVAGVYVYVVTATWPQGDVGFFLALDLIPGGA
jgi:hypothetical protein